ncbi:MAG: ABC transporter permease [Lachnospiraceae bacterium]|nr:ABC transporter permease [Lachnospiraceae bacterium]
MLENIILSFQSVWAHKVRSFLTMLGIIIGIAAIITIVSTIKGTNDQIKENLIGSGVNAVTVSLYQDEYEYSFDYRAVPEGISLLTEDMQRELRAMDKVKDISLYNYRSWAEGVFYQNTSYSGQVYGIDSHYFNVFGYALSYGRLFVDSDYSMIKKVVILDGLAAQSLFNGANPVGKTIEIKGEAYTVVGVATQKSSFTPNINTPNDYYMYMDTSGGKIFMPSAAWPISYMFDEPCTLAVSTESADDMTTVGKAVADYLTERLIHVDGFSYKAADLLDQAKKLQELSASSNKQLIWIAGISLIVGGIGVMNIMLVTVTERTKEIGLKKAIGAKKSRILRQFLTEAAVLTSLGGIIGVGAGIGLAKLLATMLQTPTAISIPAILIAVAFSTIIGILFGLIPAVKAANLNPIDALRRE